MSKSPTDVHRSLRDAERAVDLCAALFGAYTFDGELITSRLLLILPRKVSTLFVGLTDATDQDAHTGRASWTARFSR